MTPELTEYRRLDCGMELAVMPIPQRPVASMSIRLLAGYAFERTAYLGVAHVCDEAIAKGTAKRDGRALNDAFDEIGATHGSYAGRETFGFSCLCLPEFVPQAIDLLAPLTPGAGTRRGYEVVRELAPMLQRDRYLAPEIEALVRAVARGAFADIIEHDVDEYHD